MTFKKTLKKFSIGEKKGQFYSLPELGKLLDVDVSSLPVSIRIVLEAVLRNHDGIKITDQHVKELAKWKPRAKRTEEIPFVVSRVVLQDFTGVPLLADLASMRSVAESMNKDPKRIEPLVPVDLVVDHSVMIDHYGTPDALDLNMKLEFKRNQERYQFMKWGMQAFDTFGVVPPGFGIVHQVNLEHLAPGVHKTKDDVYYPDTLVGTDSHTTMINGIGVVGWGVGGIEAEAAMLGQPVYLLTPDVIGVELTGSLRGGVTATDLVLTITEMLRKEKVVGKFVEFCGKGTESLSVTDRATIANMAPEYGATMGFFPIDEKTMDYFAGTGRSAKEIDAFRAYYKAQKMFGVPKGKDINYTKLLTLDLDAVSPSVAGPKRPQDRIQISDIRKQFTKLFSSTIEDGGFNQPPGKLEQTFTSDDGIEIKNGDILIAAITSCTNTSNPSVLLAAGLLAKNAVKAGLKVKPHIKTSLAPGSRVVTEYLTKTGLLPYLEQLGFDIAAYGCTTCIGNAGDLSPAFNKLIIENDLIGAAILSGNRNFEARIHPNIKANFLASPPLVVAYALAGNINMNLMEEPIGQDAKGNDVWIGDIWPSNEDVAKLLPKAMKPKAYRDNYKQIKSNPGELWTRIEGVSGEIYNWPDSTYIARPPFFDNFSMTPGDIPVIKGARVLGIFGDSVTTDHISPAGSIKPSSPAGLWLQEHGVSIGDFNSYGSRRGNHEIMMRGTFANVRIKNLMIPPFDDGSLFEGGETLHQPSGERMSIFDAAMRYISTETPSIIFGGEEYGTGSSRDWAAKGTYLLGVKAVIARSFERIHRNNLVGMGVLPLQFKGSDSAQSLELTGRETFDISGLENGITAQQDVTLTIHREDGKSEKIQVLLRIDTPIEVEYYKSGGILPFVLRQLLA